MSLRQLHLTFGVEYFALKGNIREQSFLLIALQSSLMDQTTPLM